MTESTKALVDKLCRIVDENKYLVLSGGMASGKTFIAEAVVESAALPEYNAQGKLSGGVEKYEVCSEIIPIHPSFSYEDFVAGIEIQTVNGQAVFCYTDKIFLNILKKAHESWEKKEAKKYFVILDDIGRGPISGILGDMLPLIEPHGESAYKVTLNDGSNLCITPNVYIIATQSITVDPVERYNYGFFRHFYDYAINSDYHYMDDAASETYSDYDISANALYYRSKRIVTENIRHGYQTLGKESDRHIIGHGVFKEAGSTMVIRHQVVPLLRQYIKDGILNRSAKTGIDALEKLVAGRYSKDFSLADNKRVYIAKEGVTAEIFVREGLTHQPIVNLVSRIKEQGLLDDSDITESILFNPQVLARIKAKLDKTERTFPTVGCLYIERSKRDIYTYGTTVDGKGNPKRPRFFYSGNKNDIITVDGIEYAVASEMQPGEYTRWYEDLDTGTEVNERYSSSPNSIMFRILRSYYKALDYHFAKYLLDYPEDDNIIRLKAFAAQEYRYLVAESRKLHPETSDEKDVNAKANDDFRDVIGTLVLFWKNMGDLITVGGQTIKVEGVYKVDNEKRYEEYSKAMETLGIRQMIMQGPPGTSKTFSAREFLKYIGRDISTGNMLTDKELDDYQIKDYFLAGNMSDWSRDNPGKSPVIAWDIVQFHPSYGYEDFVRGIEVSTVKSDDGKKSSVSYETVNKVLGKMAEIAAKPEYKDTKFFLVIDEINRANLATVFGELIYGLEYRDRSVATPYTVDDSNKVLLPSNLYIIGTMNTADKSIGGIDYAIRRRFLFFSLLPNRNTILEFRIADCKSEDEKSIQQSTNEASATLFDRIAELFNSDNLNAEYYKDDVQIGHTYFLVMSMEQLYLRFRYQILPILREYYKDGMFQFEIPESDTDGWYGLLGCINGDIDINSDEDRVKDVFDKLTKAV